jgi:hypothetical protein
VRPVDTVLGTNGTFQWIYNVQPKSRPEFATGSKYRFRYTDEWTLAEWFVDHATQTYKFFVNGEEVTECSFSKGAGGGRGDPSGRLRPPPDPSTAFRPRLRPRRNSAQDDRHWERFIGSFRSNAE